MGECRETLDGDPTVPQGLGAAGTEQLEPTLPLAVPFATQNGQIPPRAGFEGLTVLALASELGPQYPNRLGLLGLESRRGLGRLSGLLQRRDETVALIQVVPLRLAPGHLGLFEPLAQTVALRAHRRNLLERGIPLSPGRLERAEECRGLLIERLMRVLVGLLASGLPLGLELVAQLIEPALGVGEEPLAALAPIARELRAVPLPSGRTPR